MINLYENDYVDENLDEREIFKAMCGTNEDGFTNCIVAIKISDFDVVDEEETVLDEIVLDNPVVNVYRNPVFTTVDLKFKSVDDFEYINTVSRLKKYTEESSKRIVDANVVSTVVLTMMPKDYLADVFCTGVHANWSLMPSNPDGGPLDTIRFIFENSFIYVYKVDEEGYTEPSEPAKKDKKITLLEDDDEGYEDDFEIWQSMYIEDSRAAYTEAQIN